MRHVALLWIFATSGCLEADQARIAPALVDAVQVSKAEPSTTCRALGALDGSSGDCEQNRYETAYATLRTNAALRGGNYVVIDLVSSQFAEGEHAITINGRVYSCPLAPWMSMLPPPVQQ
jgi:Domain of unknown function (DUF4156)